MKRTLLVALLLAATTGCGGSGAAEPAASEPTVQAGPEAFLGYLRDTNYGAKDLASATDGPLLALGNTVCDGLDAMPFGRVVQGLTTSDAGFSVREADEVGRQAVRNLCPEKTSALPS